MRDRRAGRRLSGCERRLVLALVAAVLAAGAAAGPVVATAAAATCPAGGDTYTPTTMIGGVYDWSTAGNWSTGSLPIAGQAACWSTGTAVTVSATETESVDSIQATGDLDVASGGTLILTSSVDDSALADLTLEGGGELDGADQSLAVSGIFTWGNGVPGDATVNNTAASPDDDLAIATGSVTMDDTSTPTFDGGSITVASAVVLSSNFTVSGTPALSTTAGAIIVNSNIAGSGATFSAAGGVETGIVGTYGFGSNTLDLTGGTTTVASGSTLDAGALELTNGSTLAGAGTVDAAVTNTTGTVSPGNGSPGVLSIDGSYGQGGGGTLAIELDGVTAGTGYAQLAVTGTATLAGTLALTNEIGFTPPQGAQFELLTSSGLSGAFTPVTGADDYLTPQYVDVGPVAGVTLTTLPASCPSSNFDAYTASTGDWSTGANWSTGAVPTGSEVACWASTTTVTVSDSESVDSIQADGSLDIAGGTLTLTSASDNSSVDDLSLTGGGALTGSSGPTLTVAGDFQWTSGTVSPDGASIATAGTITLGSGAQTGGTAGTFSAAGVLAGTGVTGSYGFGASNLVLTGGTTTVATGTTLAAASTTLTGGTLDGAGTIDGPVTNMAGTVAPGDQVPGLLTITGDYVQDGGGTLAVELAGLTPGSGYSQLVVDGSAQLSGDLSVTEENGFTPGLSDTFDILTSGGARSGAATLTGPSANLYQVGYDPNDVTLSLTPPPSNTQAPAITGTPSVGSSLSCSQGAWTYAPTSFSYQWKRDGTPISGATISTYVVGAADQGDSLTCTVTAVSNTGDGSAVSAEVAVPAAPTAPVAPFNITAPSITGTPTPGNDLSCSEGVWLNGPTAYGYVWKRNGSPIAGATRPSYAVQIADESQALTCAVTASGAGGAGGPIGSNAVIVAEPGTLTCAKPTGKLSGRSLGPLELGFTRSRARHTLTRYTAVGSSEDDFCLYGGWGIDAGYPSTKLLRTLSPGERGRLTGRIVLALTPSPFYALNGARPGMVLTAVAKRLHLGRPIRIGANDWYLAPGNVSRGVLRVRAGIIQEVGVATQALTNTRAAQTRFLQAFSGA